MDNPFEDLDRRLSAIEEALAMIYQKLTVEKSPSKKFYTVNEAAKELSISTGTIYRLCKLGKIPTRKFGSRIVIPGNFIDK